MRYIGQNCEFKILQSLSNRVIASPKHQEFAFRIEEIHRFISGPISVNRCSTYNMQTTRESRVIVIVEMGPLEATAILHATAVPKFKSGSMTMKVISITLFAQ